MDQRFSDIAGHPENEIFRVVFFPDRIYHAAYLNATVSKRYNYNVSEVRNKHDITLMKAKVFQDGRFLANVIRIEYRAGRLNETARESNRMLHDHVLSKLTIETENAGNVTTSLKLTYDNWIRAYQCEIWDNIQPAKGSTHHFKVLAQMGSTGPICYIPHLNHALKDLRALKIFDVVFRENDIDEPLGYKIGNPTEDNDYLRSYQVPKTSRPSAPENTVEVHNYQLNFQRGWFLDSKDVKPVRYKNAMMEEINPEYRHDETNIVEMKWILQREMGSDLVYFHEVNVTPGSFEGVHQHIGSEELYYIVSGEGIAYMGNDDDPTFEGKYPTVKQEIYCLGQKPVREIPVSPGKIIFSKSGGIHGIRNTSQTTPLIFVAFGYHCS